MEATHSSSCIFLPGTSSIDLNLSAQESSKPDKTRQHQITREVAKQQPNQRARATWQHAYSLVQKIIQYSEMHTTTLTFVSEKRWLVKLDPQHRNGKILREVWWPEWMKSPQEEREERKDLYGYNFFDWLNQQPHSQTISAVPYLSSTERDQYALRVHQDQQTLYTAIEPVPHTLDIDKPHLYVVSSSFKRYLAPYVEGFQHLSLIQTKAAGAGEMILSQGKIRIITDGSGHFLCGAAALCEMVNYLHHKRGIDMTHVAVTTGCAEEPWEGMRDTRGGKILVSKACYDLFYRIVLTSDSLKEKTFFDWIHMYHATSTVIQKSLLKFISVENAAAKKIQQARVEHIQALEKAWKNKAQNTQESKTA